MLTPAGEETLLHARHVLRAQRSLHVCHQDAVPGLLRISVRHHLFDTVLKDRMEEIQAALSPIQLAPSVIDDVDDMLRRLVEGKTDIAVFRWWADKRFLDNRELRSLFIKDIPCGLYASTGLAQQIETGALTVHNAPYVLPPADSGARGQLLELLAAAGVFPDPAAIVNASYVTKAWIEQIREGKGIGFVFPELPEFGDGAGLVRLPVRIPPAEAALHFRSALPFALAEKVAALLEPLL